MAQIDVFDIINPSLFPMKGNSPTPKQEEFMLAKQRYIAYGGARGGGKSHVLRAKAVYLAYQYNGIRILLVRKTLPQLRRNHTNKLKQIFSNYPEGVKPRYISDERSFVFPNGSVLDLGYCDSESDVEQYQGIEYDVVLIDEATHLTKYQFESINATVRGVNRFPKRTYLTCNPGNVGHAWVWRLFIAKEYKGNEEPGDYYFIQAKVWDNQPLFDSDTGYIKALKKYKKKNKLKTVTPEAIEYARQHASYVVMLKNLEEPRRSAWLNGDWSVFAGQYFGEFSTNTHTYNPNKLEIPVRWRKSLSIDYGLDMLAVLWFATDENGNSYIYRELNQPNLTISAAAYEIQKHTKETVHDYYAPPDMWNRRQDTGKSAFDTFAEHGIPFIKSSNDRLHGWGQVKEWLKLINKKPRLLISEECTELIKHIPLAQHDEKKVNDVALQPHDITHNLDALRGWCVMRHINTAVKKEKPKYNFKSEMPKRTGFASGEVTDSYLVGGY